MRFLPERDFRPLKCAYKLLLALVHSHAFTHIFFLGIVKLNSKIPVVI